MIGLDLLVVVGGRWFRFGIEFMFVVCYVWLVFLILSFLLGVITRLLGLGLVCLLFCYGLCIVLRYVVALLCCVCVVFRWCVVLGLVWVCCGWVLVVVT